MARLYVSQMAGRVADRAVGVFGGRGYMREIVAERFFRELRVERIWEGTSEVQPGGGPAHPCDDRHRPGQAPPSRVGPAAAGFRCGEFAERPVIRTLALTRLLVRE